MSKAVKATRAQKGEKVYRFSGANLQKINQIKRMFAEGMTTEEIADHMNIVPTCVESFKPKEAEDWEKPEPKPTRRRAPKKTEDE